MADFSHSLARLRIAEGGYQNHPNDTGNKNSLGQLVGTNRGISAPVYEKWIGRPPSISDMKSLSASIAANIYKKNYWDNIQGNLIRNQALADLIMDGHVNHYGNFGIKMLQEVLGIRADGAFGPITLRTVNKRNPTNIYNAYKERRRVEYYRLKKIPKYVVFFQGWMNRLARFNDFPAGSGSPPRPHTSSGGSSLAVALPIALFFIIKNATS